MNTGIQDAANLCWKIAAVDRGADAKLLDSYEEERSAVGKALLNFTEHGLKVTTTTNPILEKLRDALLPHLANMTWVQKSIAEFISETDIHYRSSSIVHDHGGDGDLRAGDRMPDVTFQDQAFTDTLLGDRKDQQHLVILLNTEERVRANFTSSLRNARVITIASSSLVLEGQKLLGEDPKVIILRPDGYIGYRGPLDHSRDLQVYAHQDALF